MEKNAAHSKSLEIYCRIARGVKHNRHGWINSRSLKRLSDEELQEVERELSVELGNTRTYDPAWVLFTAHQDAYQELKRRGLVSQNSEITDWDTWVRSRSPWELLPGTENEDILLSEKADDYRRAHSLCQSLYQSRKTRLPPATLEELVVIHETVLRNGQRLSEDQIAYEIELLRSDVYEAMRSKIEAGIPEIEAWTQILSNYKPPRSRALGSISPISYLITDMGMWAAMIALIVACPLVLLLASVLFNITAAPIWPAIASSLLSSGMGTFLIVMLCGCTKVHSMQCSCSLWDGEGGEPLPPDDLSLFTFTLQAILTLFIWSVAFGSSLSLTMMWPSVFSASIEEQVGALLCTFISAIIASFIYYGLNSWLPNRLLRGLLRIRTERPALPQGF